MSLETVIQEIEKLSAEDKRRVERALRSAGAHLGPKLTQEQWRQRVDQHFGILADDPISRGEQPTPQARSSV